MSHEPWAMGHDTDDRKTKTEHSIIAKDFNVVTKAKSISPRYDHINWVFPSIAQSGFSTRCLGSSWIATWRWFGNGIHQGWNHRGPLKERSRGLLYYYYCYYHYYYYPRCLYVRHPVGTGHHPHSDAERSWHTEHVQNSSRWKMRRSGSVRFSELHILRVEEVSEDEFVCGQELRFAWLGIVMGGSFLETRPIGYVLSRKCKEKYLRVRLEVFRSSLVCVIFSGFGILIFILIVSCFCPAMRGLGSEWWFAEYRSSPYEWELT